jgi:hypothetical protein
MFHKTEGADQSTPRAYVLSMQHLLFERHGAPQAHSPLSMLGAWALPKPRSNKEGQRCRAHGFPLFGHLASHQCPPPLGDSMATQPTAHPRDSRDTATADFGK